jgi:hypothetical protein
MAHLEQKLCPPRHTQQRHPLRITWRGCENLMAHSAAGRFFWSAANTFRSSRLGGEESDVAEAWPLLQESLKEKSLKDGLSNSMANKGWGFPTQGLVRMQSYLVSLTLNLPPPSLVLNHATLLLFSSLPLSFSLSFPPLFPFPVRRRPTRWFSLVLGGSEGWGGHFIFFPWRNQLLFSAMARISTTANLSS